MLETVELLPFDVLVASSGAFDFDFPAHFRMQLQVLSQYRLLAFGVEVTLELSEVTLTLVVINLHSREHSLAMLAFQGIEWTVTAHVLSYVTSNHIKGAVSAGDRILITHG